MKILLIDNFDSFTFNLAHYLTGLGAEVTVLRENEYATEVAAKMDKIVLSPGAGIPVERMGMQKCILENLNNKPILGVCLGMQAIVEATGGILYNQKKVKHGVQETILKQGESKLLQDIPDTFQVGLYHSWATDVSNVVEWKVTSLSRSGVCMSIESVHKKLFGVQFHPESIMTPLGKQILFNFLAQ